MIEIPKDFPWRAGMLVKACDSGKFGMTPAWRITEIVQPPEKDEDGDTVFAIGANVVDVHDAYLLVNIDAPDFPDQPDLTDPATVGALLGAVREAWRSPNAYVRRNGTIRTDDNRIVPAWEVCDLYLDDEGAKAIGASRRGGVQCALLLSEADALLAAWNARPVKA